VSVENGTLNLPKAEEAKPKKMRIVGAGDGARSGPAPSKVRTAS
jgi:hypothetical protein